MDSLAKLSNVLEDIEKSEMDHDMIITFQWEAIRFWVKDFQTLDNNIRETSLNTPHRIERWEKAIKKIKP